MDYVDAIGKALPGSFVPDIGSSGLDAPTIAPLGDNVPAVAPETGLSFKETVKSLLDGVNDKQLASEQSMRDLADGKTNDLNKVATTAEEANLALSLTMAMRSKLLEAYQEVERISV